METWRMIVYCTAIFSYGTDNKKKPSFWDECCRMYIHKYTYIYIYICFLVYVDNTHLLIHTSLYIVHISFSGIPTKFANFSLLLLPLAFHKGSLLVKPKDGFLQLGSLSEYGDGGLLSTPLWDLRFSAAAAALDGTSELEMMWWWAFSMVFFGGFGEPKMEDYQSDFFLYWNIRWRNVCCWYITWIFFWRSRLNSTRIYSIKPFPFFLASGMTRVQYHQIIVLLVHWHGKGKLHKIQVIDQKSRT